MMQEEQLEDHNDNKIFVATVVLLISINYDNSISNIIIMTNNNSKIS